MLPPRQDGDGRCPSAVTLPGQDRGDRHGAGRLDDELRPLEQHEQRPGDVVVADRDDLVDELADDLEVQLARACSTAMPSAMVGAIVISVGSPAASEGG